VSKKLPAQIAFAFAGDGGDFIFTRPLMRHRLRRSLLEKLRYVRRFFPELAGRTIRVGLTRSAAGLAVPGGDEVWVNPAQASYQTLAHEFVHLLQGKRGIPAGEKSCDVFALARHWTLNDSAPYYLRVPGECLTEEGRIRPGSAKLVFDVARSAVGMRKAGMRNYIAYFEKTLERLRHSRAGSAGHRPAGRPGATAAPGNLQVEEFLAAPDGDPLD
jgi:hypothetical protein